ncbi:MAG: hypothetical protein Q9M11_07215 [Mariprofundaceae bacterium]|nr:hypothetical protein [Mariprofundaceae bacterium]
MERSRKVPFVIHYLDKYGKLPIWVSTDLWDFGLPDDWNTWDIWK